MANKSNGITGILGGIVMFLFFSYFFIQDLRVFISGDIVSVKITDLPEGSYARTKPMYFVWGNVTYHKNIKEEVRDQYQEGQTIQLRHLKGQDDNFKFLNENLFKEYWYYLLLFVVMVVVIVQIFRG